MVKFISRIFRSRYKDGFFCVPGCYIIQIKCYIILTSYGLLHPFSAPVEIKKEPVELSIITDIALLKIYELCNLFTGLCNINKI